MYKRIFFLTLLFIIVILPASDAQTDKWSGTWRMQYKPWPHIPAVIMELQIGKPGYQMLYPALLKLTYGSFSGTYKLLLAKKNDRQLGIGRTKYPIKEDPFKLGAWLLYLNGTFTYTANGKLPASIRLSRMWIDDFGLFMKGLYDDDEIFVSTKVTLRDFLYRDSIQLKKINNDPWVGAHANRIIHPEKDSIYFGIYNRLDVTDSIAQLLIRDEDQLDKDTVTLLHNSRVLLDKAEINALTKEQSIRLDTGMNILTLFADNYGKLPPNTGNLVVTLSKGTYHFDFTHRPNVYATFLVAQLYRKPAGSFPAAPVIDTAKQTTMLAARQNQSIGSVVVNQPEVTLELWDEQQEDGDSISLRLNNRWIVSGMAVKNAAQQITVQLQPGENWLLFMADNLGSIPPNTAVLRIIYGTRSKTLDIKTDLNRNNVISILYKPGG